MDTTRTQTSETQTDPKGHEKCDTEGQERFQSITKR